MSAPHDGEALHVMLSLSHSKVTRLALAPVSRVSPFGQIDMGRVEAESRMNVEHVARGVVYMATLPLKANVQFMTVMATKVPYIGRG